MVVVVVIMVVIEEEVLKLRLEMGVTTMFMALYKVGGYSVVLFSKIRVLFSI